MKDRIAPVKNIERLAELGETLKASNPRTPRIGVVYGDTGFGKSTGLTWYGVRKARAAYVRAMELWTAGAMLKAIGRELSIEVSRELTVATEQVIAELSNQNRMLLIDEADYVVDKRRLINTLRDIADVAQTPIILVGMEDFAKKLKARLDQRQFAGRVAFEMQFKPLDLDDAQLLARELLEVDIDDDLLKKLHEVSEGSIRLLCVGLQRIETHAKAKGLKKATAKEWGDRPLNLMAAADKGRTLLARDTLATV